MKAVVAVPDNRARERLCSYLRAHGIDVVDHSTFPVTRNAARDFNADLVIARTRDISLIRNASRHRRPYVIAALPIVNDAAVNAALQQGADDLLAVNACAAEVLARAEMPKRMQLLRDNKPPDGIERLEIWQNAPRVLSQDVGAMFGLFMQAAEFDDGVPGATPSLAATIRVASTVEDTIVRIFVGLSEAEGEKMSSHVFGSVVGEDVMRDALREISNNLAGSFKRSALTEGTTVTLGLPTDCRVSDLVSAGRVWTAECEHFQAVVGISKVTQFTRRVKAMDLRPGMVLKHDIRSAAGAALVRAGTALTERTASRLLEYCDPGAFLEVLDAEPAEAEAEAGAKAEAKS